MMKCDVCGNQEEEWIHLQLVLALVKGGEDDPRPESPVSVEFVLCSQRCLKDATAELHKQATKLYREVAMNPPILSPLVQAIILDTFNRGCEPLVLTGRFEAACAQAGIVIPDESRELVQAAFDRGYVQAITDVTNAILEHGEKT